MKEALIRLPHARVTWLCAIFLLGYVGIEVALGGWIVKFMLEVRDGEDFASGMTATGFWMGITVGRLVLGFVTPKLGEKLAIAVSPVIPFHEVQNIGDVCADMENRSTSRSPWPSSLSSGWFRNFMSQPLRSPSKDSSLARCFLLPLLLLRSFYHATCMLVRLGLQQRLVALGPQSSRLRLVQLHKRKACRFCSRLSWHCWV